MVTRLTKKRLFPFNRAYRDCQKLYHEAFPKEERFPFFPLVVSTIRPMTSFYAYYDQGQFVGLAQCFECADLVFVMFLAIDKSMRSHGYGRAILEEIKEIAHERPVVLTIEPVEERFSNYWQRVKRLAFYQKNGFHETTYDYYEGKERYQVLATKPIGASLLESLLKKAVLGFISIKIVKK